MPELLAPAGSLNALIAAISNGADAVYLGLNKFGARAYAENFTLEELKTAIEYAHLRNVKLYVTMNTIVYDDELPEAYQQIDSLYLLGVDGLILQDLALFTYVKDTYPSMEAHCSTQMGIDDVNGVLFFKKLKADRIVLARELPLEQIKKIKQQTNMPLEIFIHGALCVSYSGNCLMSGLIGYRSGNRGRCVGSCRKKYALINTTTQECLSDSYILSMKDLKTIEHISELSFADSLKIEGRMKEPEYVANVVHLYRKALDKTLNPNEIDNLYKTFHRTYTKGYLFQEDKKTITNDLKPNNFGYKIGTITKKTKIGYEIRLIQPLNQFDVIRIDHNNKDINLTITKLYDEKDNLISTSSTFCYIKIKESLSIGDTVYKTKDISYYKSLNLTKEYKKFPIRLTISGQPNSPLYIIAECENKTIEIESDFLLQQATTSPTTKTLFYQQFNRLTNTIYYMDSLEYYIKDCFIPVAKINELRRKTIEKINLIRLSTRHALPIKKETFLPLFFPQETPELAVYCTTKEQYEAALSLNIKTIYYKDSIVRRNQTDYKQRSNELLIGGYGGIYYYKNTNSFITDYSLNVVNYKTVYLLHKMGAKRVTLSYEINEKQIKTLIQNYVSHVGGYPNLELIVYGHAPMMFTKYCPLKTKNQCGICRTNSYILKDDYGSFPILNHDDCTTTILNGKILNLIDHLDSISSIHTYRIQLTIESKEESKEIIQAFQNKLNHAPTSFSFRKDTDTRGHFNKEIL